ncbi:MAG: N-acetylglucosamine-6-phosphate deacetylase [Thalassovita sp.]
MSHPVKAFCGAAFHDGTALYAGRALLTFSDGRATLVTPDEIPADTPRQMLDGGTLMPGFVDLQVNGGGGVMFNDAQTVETLGRIAKAHAGIGTAGLLPTLITDTPQHTANAIQAVEDAIAAKTPGIIGIHLEGPHLSVARKGAHDPNLIRPITDTDMQVLLGAAERLPNVMLTLAPENASNQQIRRLAEAGIIISLGHTDADYDTCMAAFDAGARCVTHLFNAMSQLGNREPGLVGAALAHGEVYAGLIADGIHVHPASMRAALAGKTGADRLFLVTDAMATAGSSVTKFHLNGREVLRQDARLTLGDGTLAGADLELCRSIDVLVNQVGIPAEDAIRRATSVPASLLRDDFGLGRFNDRSDTLIYASADWRDVTPLSAL